MGELGNQLIYCVLFLQIFPFVMAKEKQEKLSRIEELRGKKNISLVYFLFV